jgi:hypothetical protein
VLIDNPWLSFLAYFVLFVKHGQLSFRGFCLMMDWLETTSQEMCEPLRELLGMVEAQEANRRELRQEEEAIRRAHERRRRQEQIRQQLREMAERGQDAEGLNSQNFS